MTSVLLYSGLSILLFLVTGDYIYSVSVYGDQFCFVLAPEILFFSAPGGQYCAGLAPGEQIFFILVSRDSSILF